MGLGQSVKFDHNRKMIKVTVSNDISFFKTNSETENRETELGNFTGAEKSETKFPNLEY